MIKTIAVNKAYELIKDLEIEKLVSGEYLWYWIDFDRPNHEEIELLKKPLSFHPLAIEDCTNTLQRPKLDYYEDHIFFVTQSINPTTHLREEVNLFLGENYIVTFHQGVTEEVDKVWKQLELSSNLKQWEPIQILYHILDNIVDNYFPLVEKIEDTLNEIDENSNKKSMGSLLDELFETRNHLLSLRHVVSPMRDLAYRLLNSQRFTEIQKKKAYFSDIHDHLLKLTEMIEENRELTTDIRDSYISLNSHQANRVMKVLTVITTIFMPLTLIAGIYGMNFENMPELKWKYGYFEALALMFLIGSGMFIWFKKKGWFK
ncbi:magnesium/cobalt transporter CorA [Lederbergia citrea]|uniref:Magnesium transport protein CorA n=1 Tax=Lederbergia citrea TaxID=2833581 RepID=A0A942UIG3_9BACI|nr:magnesium/cobalt transporter CorA [Lederbergia citrea]MBS4176702.1 magnesium/cobalt transporter CorA [Lederbergia citrea]MBS4203263.1 magnesium/cobalt transporter CorA [Lederbergia citrea]MBS4222066.1 magnesium/cobalt transporter CorA [Lederbergia citrea]